MATVVRALESATRMDECEQAQLQPYAGETRLFKAPSLRSVGLTGPYMHDGRFATLEQAVRNMWDYQQKAGVAEKLTDNDLRDLVEYLKSL